MDLEKFFKITNLEKCFVIGYYGGTNFGDELLLEIVLNALKNKGVRDVSFYYSDKNIYSTYHKDFGYRLVSQDFKSISRNILRSKSIIIGGGGLWGLDFNKNIAILSTILFISRFLFFKKVYLIGVGSYNSSGKIGKFFSAIAALSANIILPRDHESFNRFRKLNRSTFQSKDLAFLLPSLNLSDYLEKNQTLESFIKNNSDIIFASTRHFSEKIKRNKNISFFNNELYKTVESSHLKFVFLLLNSQEFDPDTFAFYNKIKSNFPNSVLVIETNFNPILIYLLLKKYNSKITVLSPQYHMQLIANITRTKFIPICYDNKNKALYRMLGIKKYKDISQVDALYLTENLKNDN